MPVSGSASDVSGEESVGGGQSTSLSRPVSRSSLLVAPRRDADAVQLQELNEAPCELDALARCTRSRAEDACQLVADTERSGERTSEFGLDAPTQVNVT